MGNKQQQKQKLQYQHCLCAEPLLSTLVSGQNFTIGASQVKEEVAPHFTREQ